VKPKTKGGQWNKNKRPGIFRSTLSKSKAVKRQMSSHTNYQQRNQQRRPQNQVWERSQPIQNWKGDRSFRQNRISQGNSHGFPTGGFNSWQMPGKNNGGLKPIQNKKRSLFIARYNDNGRRSAKDSGRERRSRDSSMRRRRVR